MSRTNSLHYNLCVEGAKWIKDFPFGGYKYIAVELVSLAAENPDVWGTNGCESMMIEVKTNRADFLKDKEKFCRIHSDYAVGNYRYYLCPERIIKVNDLPDNWGLLWYDGKTIKTVKTATYIKTCNRSELTLLSSIMRREGIKPQIFNYKNKSTES